MQGFRVFRRSGDVRLDDLDDEEIVFGDEGVVVKTALEAGAALGDQRRRGFRGFGGGPTEMLEFVDLGASCVVDPDDDVQ